MLLLSNNMIGNNIGMISSQGFHWNNVWEIFIFENENNFKNIFLLTLGLFSIFLYTGLAMMTTTQGRLR